MILVAADLIHQIIEVKSRNWKDMIMVKFQEINTHLHTDLEKVFVLHANSFQPVKVFCMAYEGRSFM